MGTKQIHVGTIPSPGTKYGHCIDKCNHFDCNYARKHAASFCYFCGKPIGYDVKYYIDDNGNVAHASCVLSQFGEKWCTQFENINDKQNYHNDIMLEIYKYKNIEYNYYGKNWNSLY